MLRVDVAADYQRICRAIPQFSRTVCGSLRPEILGSETLRIIATPLAVRFSPPLVGTYIKGGWCGVLASPSPDFVTYIQGSPKVLSRKFIHDATRLKRT